MNAFHLQLAGLEADVYLEFVPSLANIADLPSRNEFELLDRLGGRRIGITLCRRQPIGWRRSHRGSSASSEYVAPYYLFPQSPARSASPSLRSVDASRAE